MYDSAGRSSQRNSQHGFTLIEAVVVSVLMAILATVAIPLYSSYVSSQRDQNVKNLVQSASVSANVLSRKGITPTPALVKAAMYLPDTTAYSITINDGARTITVTDVAHSTYSATLPY